VKFGSKWPALAHLLALRQPIGFFLALGCDLQWNIVTVEPWEGGVGAGMDVERCSFAREIGVECCAGK
jgi:hypothetical protein